MPPKRTSRSQRKTNPTHDTSQDEASSKPRPKVAKSTSTKAAPNAESLTKSPTHFTIPNPSKPTAKPIHCLHHCPSNTSPSLIFTHGAGGDLSAPAVVDFSTGFTETSPLLCFEGSSNLASRAAAFAAVIANEESSTNGFAGALGGRSLGARATVVAATALLKGGGEGPLRLVLVSYPLNGPKGAVRDEILLALPKEVELLFISGSRDGMCDLAQLNEVRARMEAKSWLVVVRGADHGMHVTPKTATAAVGEETGRVAAAWLGGEMQFLPDVEIRWDQEEGQVTRGQYGEEDDVPASNRKAKDKLVTKKGDVPLARARKSEAMPSKDAKVSTEQPDKDGKPIKKRKSAANDLETSTPASTPSGNARSSKRKNRATN
ncbi:uncharacterized protein BDZ99DRAFT_434551 [Mytilinidion resinicola]|uniref:KANL3/Tex30 alpha/beta hydrolase-like domain-containing protein n=1 Tax=Mytilinidion resinicola TaxID=574789 RepID=A0A6A6Z249_9PEZI|nr:uncharacterized protein BDZ99DRAFT_434551 [Mytilinidion resinicola]KAF2814743.1 hypothetical protein BDZ99DRAFT_434551 [Mytilinidion resinicola]